mgnify:FL=1
MARKRFISPEFFQHEALYDLERSTGLPIRVAFAGLWTQSDRRGIFAWRPRVLKLAILPYDDVDFAAVLDALYREGFIRWYEVDGKPYGIIESFARWQSFHRDERQSDAPPPPEHGASTVPPRCSPVVPLPTAQREHGSSTPVTTSITATASIADAVAADAASPAPGAAFAGQLAELQAAALPHERLALDQLLGEVEQSRPGAVYNVIGSIHAVASGMHVLRSERTGRAANAADCMQAVAEMFANGERWNISRWRGYVGRLVNAPPQPPSAEEREAARLAKEVAAVAQVELPPDTPEQAEARRLAREAALASFRAQFHRTNAGEAPVERLTVERIA